MPGMRHRSQPHPISRSLIAVLSLSLMLSSDVGAAAVGAGRKVIRPDAAVVRLLLAPPSSWSRSLAEVFVKTIPVRIEEPLSMQTAKTIPYFVTQARVPRRIAPRSNEYICWASTGSGGGFMAIIRRQQGKNVPVWDSLIAPGFVAPHIEFEDLDGDSIPEIICWGERLEGGANEWAIVRWNGSEARLLAPRLDRPAKSLWDNRLIGRALRMEETPGDSAKTLVLTLGDTSGSDSSAAANSADSTKVFRYNRSVDGFLPLP